ncbi:MAG: alpha/beta hydrolase [Microgenomates group bacterium]
MTAGLKFGRRAPVSGKARNMVVFLHGYGANGDDLLGLADPLSGHMRDTVFIAPDAPDACSGTPFGRQWFGIPAFDGSSLADAMAAMEKSALQLNAFLDVRMADEGLSDAQVMLLGFSQGAMMSLHVAPRRKTPFAGVIAISGRLIRPDRLQAELVVKPPVLLIHGDQDPVVDFAKMGKAGDALVAAGLETFGHVMKGTGHGIAPDGLGIALAFMKERLG